MSHTGLPFDTADHAQPARRARQDSLMQMNGKARRAIFLIHRWLGIVLALLMAVWAFSGIVMMYVGFPETTEAERLAGLEPLELAQCCDDAAIPVSGSFDDVTVEMTAGTPVLRWRDDQEMRLFDLARGRSPVMDPATAELVAGTHFRRVTGMAATPQVDAIDRDQWTVYGRFRQHNPLYKAQFDDEAGSVLYVSGTTAQVVQDTTATERFWNWLGAVPHWLYFTAFREQQGLWYNSVVYASLLSVFLTVTGLYIGIRQYGRGSRRIPYRGMAYWHHLTGLIFGILTLTWVVSGLFSMNPWGWLESEGPGQELSALAGRPATGNDVRHFVTALANNQEIEAVSAELSIQDGKSWAILSAPDGGRVRTKLQSLDPNPLSDDELAELAGRAKPRIEVASQGMIRQPDSYYYGHHDEIILPVWRVIYKDEEETRLYFDPRTGQLVRKVDSNGRAYRWLHHGLHRLDFSQSMRTRPIWDILVLPLMLGVSALCLIGLVVGIKRLRRRKSAVRR